MIKKILFISAFVISASPVFAGEVVQRGSLSIEHCVTARLPNGSQDPFSQDRCRAAAVAGMGKSCQVTVESSGGIASSVTMGTPLWSRRSSVPRGSGLSGGAIERQYGKNGFSNYSLNGFSGRMIRGNVIVRRDSHGDETAATKMEVFDNLDENGNEYIRYRCANLHAVHTASMEEATVEPASVDGDDAAIHEEGSGATAI